MPGRRRARPGGDPLLQGPTARPSRSASTSRSSTSTPRPAGSTLRRFIAVDDCGTVINPLLLDGQRHGGIAQGAAQALCEEVVYDEDGQLITGSLGDYAIPTAHDLPNFELDRTETPSPRNPLGVKGIGEAGTIGSTPAVRNAVLDALLPLGITNFDMPASSPPGLAGDPGGARELNSTPSSTPVQRLHQMMTE